MENYEVLRRLGAGMFGIAYLTRKKITNECFALKAINISHMPVEEIQEAKSEAKILSTLDHPHITQFYESFVNNSDQLVIVMEYCGSGSLRTLIQGRDGNHFTEDQVLDWFHQLVDALDYIHQKKILHRDVKPDNLFVTDDSKIKLADFGISKILGMTSEYAMSKSGTKGYFSPELLKNEPYNAKSDVWAATVVLHEMASLIYPFDGKHIMEIYSKICDAAYAPIPDIYSNNFKLLLKKLFQVDHRARLSAADILRLPIIARRASKVTSLSLDTEVEKRERIKEEEKNKEHEKAQMQKAEAERQIQQAAIEKREAIRLKAEAERQIQQATIEKKEAIRLKAEADKERQQAAIKITEKMIAEQKTKNLYRAAEAGKLEEVKDAHQLGGNINWQNPDDFDQTPLWVASANGHLNTVQYLLQEGAIATINVLDQYGASPLWIASSRCHLEVVKCLHGEYSENINLANKNGTTPWKAAEWESYYLAEMPEAHRRKARAVADYLKKNGGTI